MPAQTLDLGHGLSLRCDAPALAGTVHVTLLFAGIAVFDRTVTQGQPQAELDVDLALLRAKGALDFDAFLGELAWSGELRVRPPGGAWRDVLPAQRSVVARICPAAGRVGRAATVDVPVVADPRFGRSHLCTPTVLRIFVDDGARELADVGRLVKRHMFPEHPGFVFNTVACVGGVASGAPGFYTDPASIWFNVFFGYYQLDAPKATWPRPFAYRAADGVAAEVEIADVLRLGKADWNWFSNWMYGVPAGALVPYSGVDPGTSGVERGAPLKIGATRWHPLTLRGVKVASAYESGAPGAARLVHNTVLDAVWRPAFGLPSPRPDFPESFIPTTLDARLWMAYWDDAAAYHTVIFGGTQRAGTDPAFLDVQMDALRVVIERSYATLGFP